MNNIVQIQTSKPHEIAQRVNQLIREGDARLLGDSLDDLQ
jgi:hypothetical protein